MNLLLDKANSATCGCDRTQYCNRMAFVLPKSERYTNIGVYFLGAMLLRYIVPIVIGFIFMPDVGIWIYSYPFVTLVGYSPIYYADGVQWIFILNIGMCVLFYGFSFYAVGWRCIPPILIVIASGVLTLPVMGAFQPIGMLINIVVCIIPWELGTIEAFAKKNLCDLPLPKSSSA